METNKDKWYYSGIAIFLAILIAGPLGLIPLWKSPKGNFAIKVCVTVIVMLFTIYLIYETVIFVKIMLEHYSEIASV